MPPVIRGPVTIAPGEEWTSAASTWPVMVVSRETDPAQLGPDGLIIALDEGRLELTEPVLQLHLVCARCPGHPSVLCLSPGTGESYRIAWADALSGILAHLRRTHPDVVTS